MKIKAMFFVAVLFLFQLANAGRPGLGTAIGVGLGAVVGAYTEKQLEDALKKPDYKSENFELNATTVSVKIGDEFVPLKVQSVSDEVAVDRLVKTLNKIDVTQSAAWENMHNRVRVCASESDCCDLVIEATKGETMDVYLDAGNVKKGYLVRYHAQEPSVLTKVRNFILGHILFFAIVVFGIAGYVWDSMKKRKNNKR